MNKKKLEKILGIIGKWFAWFVLGFFFLISILGAFFQIW